jgi:hypothetical protein
VNDPEIDDLHRIVIHDEDVARLEVACSLLFMRCLKTPARLCDDPTIRSSVSRVLAPA